MRQRNILLRILGSHAFASLSIRCGRVAGQLTVNSGNMKLVKVASPPRASWRDSSVCCSRLCDSRAAVSYWVTDLSAFHAPFFFDFDQAPHMASSVRRGTECRVWYGTKWILMV